jgi:hypothetical protein
MYPRNMVCFRYTIVDTLYKGTNITPPLYYYYYYLLATAAAAAAPSAVASETGLTEFHQKMQVTLIGKLRVYSAPMSSQIATTTRVTP